MSPRHSPLSPRARTTPETQPAPDNAPLCSAILSRGRRRAAVLCAAALLAVCAASEVAFAGSSFAVRPAPAWVRQVEAPPPSGGGGQGGSLFLLDDHQTRVEGRKVERFSRHVRKVLSAAGLEQESELQLGFEPSYQDLVIHHVRVLRGGRVIDALDPSEVSLIRQEEELDQRIYNGQLTAVVVLKDVRIGDTIDYAYTVSGDNPVMGGRFDDEFYLADAEPVRRLFRRLVWPTGRALHLRPSNTDARPFVAESGGATEYVWGGEDVVPVVYEEGAPAWYDPAPRVQFGEFESWAEVVGWALPLYRAGEASPELRAKIEEWRRASDDPARRLLAALRFVQDEVRYLGIELGPYSHQPTQPSKVLARRFGDCKDKSLLLATALNALGIEAHTALVNTEAGAALDGEPPSPYAFDHVIVRASVGGRTYWLDPTVSNQRGALDAYYPPGFGRALVLREGSDALERIPDPTAERPTVEVAESYAVEADGRGASFEVVTTYRGPDADGIRYALAQRAPADLARESLNYYVGRYPSIRADGPPRITDDEEANVVVIGERYIIPRFWLDGRRVLSPDRIDAALDATGTAERAAPLAISHPLHLRHVIEARLPEAQHTAADSGTVANAAFSLSYSREARGNTIRLEYTLRSVGDHVPAARVTEYLEDLAAMRGAVGYELSRDGGAGGAAVAADDSRSVLSPRPAFGQRAALLSLLLVPAALLLAAIVYGVRRRRRLLRQEAWRQFGDDAREPAAGATPETAIRLRSDGEMREHVGAWACGCGRAYQREGERLHQEGLTYDGESLVLVRLRCGTCADAREAYFVRPATRPEEPAGVPAAG